MEWEGGKSDRYALVTICFRDGDREHYDEVIYSKDTFVSNDHVELMQMMYGGVSDDPVDGGVGGSPYEEYWHDGMNAVSIYRVRYLTTQEAETLKKFDVAVDLGAESWQGVSLAGGVDEIEEMLKRKAEFEALPYGNLYGACLLPDGSCMETSLDTCNLMGGRFQGPGTSCNPDDNYLRPRVMRSRGKVYLILLSLSSWVSPRVLLPPFSVMFCPRCGSIVFVRIPNSTPRLMNSTLSRYK